MIIIGAVFVIGAVTLGPTLYRVTIGLKRYEATPPSLPPDLNENAVLIFSKTNGYRDDAQIEAANRALAQLAAERGWTSYVTENAAVFNSDQLKRFRVVVWSSASGDVLTPEQRAALKSWIERGGGFVGLHGSGGDLKYAWRWYVDHLIGAQFIGHTMQPQFQKATIVIEDPHHPATRGLGQTWVRTDEWYSFASSPRSKGYHILARLDESTYRPVMKLPFMPATDLRMGRDHPVIWTHCEGEGRALYSALGHAASTYSEPKHLQMIGGAITWAAGLEGPGCKALASGRASSPVAEEDGVEANDEDGRQ
jgi:type 1 glutamine amidotransferase